MDFSILLTWDGITYLLILTLLEVVLGIDNIIFISISTDRLPEKQRRSARNLGLILALVARLLLLSMVAWLMQLTDPIFTLPIGEGVEISSLWLGTVISLLSAVVIFRTV